MKQDPFKPFANEEQSTQIGELTVENRTDRVEIYGSLAVTKDKVGLRLALEARELIDSIIQQLERDTLPEAVETIPADVVVNPLA